jgi:hypothetical protein
MAAWIEVKESLPKPQGAAMHTQCGLAAKTMGIGALVKAAASKRQAAVNTVHNRDTLVMNE